MSGPRSRVPSTWFPLAVQVGDADVYVALGATPADTIVWHWCTTDGRWNGAMLALHTIVTRDPLTITASLLHPECGWHGWITDGKWVPV